MQRQAAHFRHLQLRQRQHQKPQAERVCPQQRTPAPSPEHALIWVCNCLQLPSCLPSQYETSCGEADGVTAVCTTVLVAWRLSSEQQHLRKFPAGRLKLGRPLVAFDLETTGLDTKRDRIVEFAAVRTCILQW